MYIHNITYNIYVGVNVYVCMYKITVFQLSAVIFLLRNLRQDVHKLEAFLGYITISRTN